MVLSTKDFKYHKLMNYLLTEKLMDYIILLYQVYYLKVHFIIQIYIEYKRMLGFEYYFDQY